MLGWCRVPNLAGIWNPKKSRESIAEVVGRQADRIRTNRGNYSEYTFIDEGFGATLLDHDIFENGPQPARSQDGRYVLWLDGEIQNPEELKTRYRKTLTDVPESTPGLCLELLRTKGPGCIRELKGLFVIVFYD